MTQSKMYFVLKLNYDYQMTVKSLQSCKAFFLLFSNMVQNYGKITFMQVNLRKWINILGLAYSYSMRSNFDDQ